MAHRRTQQSDNGETAYENRTTDGDKEISAASKHLRGELSRRPRAKYGASSPSDVKFTPPFVGVIMALSLPVSLLVFWYITLPFLWWLVSSIVGVDFIRNIMFLKEDIAAALTSPCALWIPADERAYLNDHSDWTVKRLSNVTANQFIDFVNRGEPVIVTDAMKDWESFHKFNCTYLIENYPDVEYFDWQGGRRMPIRYIPERWEQAGMECASGYIEMSWPANNKYLKEWSDQMPAPYFLPKDVYTDGGLAEKTVSMTGFLGTPSTGVSPHLDETCDTFMTVQFSGVKNWSISWPVRESDELKWAKPTIVTLYPGDILFWYVSMRHHTEVLEGCSLSFSFLLNTPAPKQYFENLHEDFKAVTQTERNKLFASTHAANLDYIDSCSIVHNNGKDYII
ncbi:uncharacterized protein [Ptychodera flava]|uniref:uncharacterized protein n=1 Tax=Ptychodera flava TaxID=63121 RepID=UPI00396A703A